MNFLIHSEDGQEEGRVTQSNKVFDPTGYDKLLKERGLQFVGVDHRGVLNPDKVFVKDGEVTERPLMPITVSKTTIKAGGNDSAVFRNVPKNAEATCFVDGMILGGAVIPTGEFDLPIPIPCTYRVVIKLWPFQDFVVDITAEA